MVFIEGDRVVLRSVDCSDIDTLLLWENANDEPLYGIYEEQYTREDVVQFVENQQLYSLAENEQLRLMICSHEGERLGCIDLSYYDGRKAFVSILIVDLGNRRKGFGSALYARILPENNPSISLFEKVGFAPLESGIYSKSIR